MEVKLHNGKILVLMETIDLFKIFMIFLPLLNEDWEFT